MSHASLRGRTRPVPFRLESLKRTVSVSGRSFATYLAEATSTFWPIVLSTLEPCSSGEFASTTQ